MNKCLLQKELNSCPDLANGNICTRPLPHSCCMLDVEKKAKNGYIRKERWYEKYYKGSK